MVKDVINREPSIKKRRKNSSNLGEANKPENDPYQKITAFEEVEAFKRSPEKDAELYFQTSNNIRQLFAEIAKLKKLGTPEALEQISEKKVETTMLIAVLKKLNRLEKFRTKSARDALHQEKLQADSTKLQLQNLLYELSYLKKEISKCFQFKSLDEEIELIPEKEFYKNAPVTISRKEVTKNDPHQLQLARLEWELQQRKELSSQCRELEVEKEKVAQHIVEKQERLDQLGPQLNKVLESMKPLQEHLGLAKDKTHDHHLAYLLSNSLYLLYAKALAYCQVYDKLTQVKIIGSEEEARQLKEDLSSEKDLAADSDSDQELDENADRQKHHHRKSSRAQQQEEQNHKLLAPHPLNLRITIQLDKEHDTTLTIDLFYRIKLKIVTVKCQVLNKPSGGPSASEILSPQILLHNLFPNDGGEDSPNPSNHYQLAQLGMGPFSGLIDQLGHAYLWAQNICGLDFISSQPPLQHVCIESIMQAIRRRFRARMYLSQQVQELENGVIPIPPTKNNLPLKLTCTISLWRRLTWEDYCSCPSTNKFVSSEHVSSSDLLYKLQLVRDSATLDALIAIKSNFPKDRCVFAVTLHFQGDFNSQNLDGVKEMERVVNTEWPDKSDVWILAAQVRRLMACFDVYLEVIASDQFTQEKIYFKPIRGRNRSLPFKFLNIGSGVCTQY